MVYLVEAIMYSFPNPIRLSSSAERIIFVILPLMHIAGVVGLQLPVSQSLFKTLVPFHLLSCVGLLFLFQEEWNTSTIILWLTSYLVGFFIEALGVHTGLIFGAYHYGETLGWKIIDIPVLIGANWLILVFCTGVVIQHLHPNKWLKAAVGAALIVFIDVLIEPVAIKLDFWVWEGPTVPLQNYIAWYIISFGLLCLFYSLSFPKKNRIAGLLLICQALFFAVHNFIYQLL